LRSPAAGRAGSDPRAAHYPDSGGRVPHRADPRRLGDHHADRGCILPSLWLLFGLSAGTPMCTAVPGWVWTQVC